jgi:hypothetical protein
MFLYVNLTGDFVRKSLPKNLVQSKSFPRERDITLVE